jgi:oligoendopeptidase F
MTFQRNLPTWHRYWRLRRRVLGVETLHEYDIKAPLTQDRSRCPIARRWTGSARAWRRWARNM